MRLRLVSCVLSIILLCLALGAAAAEEAGDARSRVTAYAQMIHDYTWELPEEEGYILVYNRNYDPAVNGNRIVFRAWQPYVVYGTVRGIPYSLSVYGNGRERTFEQYSQLPLEERAEIANIYTYGKFGRRISMRYGMSCATFLSECLRQGFPDEDLPIMRGVVTLMSDARYKRHFEFGKHGKKDYPLLQPADLLRVANHVMLVMDNDPEHERLLVMEQTPPDHAVANCNNLTDVTITLTYRGQPTTLQAKRLCMECEACRQATTGTQLCWVDYDALREDEYLAVFVKY